MNFKLISFSTIFFHFLISFSFQSIFVDQGANPHAEFEFDIIGRAPAEVQFLNKSENATDYLWDFGDGNTSTEKNPVHVYAKGGPYIVTLKAINSDKTDRIQAIVKIEEKPSVVSIENIVLKEMPLLRANGKAWDRDGGVELFLTLLDGNTNNNKKIFESDLICNGLNINRGLPLHASFQGLSLKLKNDSYFVVYHEYDEWSDNETIGYVPINFNDYVITGTDQYPNLISIERQGLVLELLLKWF